jgi:hypothetical protein
MVLLFMSSKPQCLHTTMPPCSYLIEILYGQLNR